ncbi:DUF7544 domain-containing protein [Halohasta litorea]|uniref:Membrane domain of glycerophosphoryl diester phosphodiesterase n=1 Tax=Halohasta litorea TaxID=869891 RepID=A0ABD6D8H0_9EURY|nr:hypothetical protein [Halohasta litorea]MEA1931735.1 hypothetical protein [Euryarchaeota archaeon]
MAVFKTLTDAGGLTKQYLSALGAGGWLKLGVVVLFLGGSGLTSQFTGLPIGPETVSDPSELWAAAGVIAAGLLIIGAFGYIAAVLEFVFVDSLRSRSLSLRLYIRSNLGAGVRLLLFRVGVWLASIAVVAVPVAWTVFVGDVTTPAEVTPTQVIGIGLTAVVALFGLTTVNTLTTLFVVPVMLHEQRGALSGWRRFVDAAAANKLGVLATVLLAWLIGFILWAVLTIVGFVIGIVGVFGIVLGGSALTELSSAFEPLIVGAFVAGLIAYQYVVSLVVAPVRSYVRYYALVVLGDAEPRLDLIPTQREAVESDNGVAEAGGDTTASRKPAASGDDPETED